MVASVPLHSLVTTPSPVSTVNKIEWTAVLEATLRPPALPCPTPGDSLGSIWPRHSLPTPDPWLAPQQMPQRGRGMRQSHCWFSFLAPRCGHDEEERGGLISPPCDAVGLIQNSSRFSRNPWSIFLLPVPCSCWSLLLPTPPVLLPLTKSSVHQGTPSRETRRWVHGSMTVALVDIMIAWGALKNSGTCLAGSLARAYHALISGS